MTDDYPSKLQLWEGGTPALVSGAAAGRLVSPGAAEALAPRLFAAEAMQTGRKPRGLAEPYSLQWFLEAESVRYGRHGRWLPRLLEFGKHSGESLLGLGDGLGADWVQYARCGAEVTACSTSVETLALVRRNFELRGLTGQFVHADPAKLPLESASLDVVCVQEVLPTAPDPNALVEEIYRVLKPGGKVLMVTPALHDAQFWSRCLFPLRDWIRRPAPPRGGMSRRSLRRLFGQFIEHRIHKRHLRRSESPYLMRWLPLPVLERLMGRFLVLKAFKPLSAALSLQIAA